MVLYHSSHGKDVKCNNVFTFTKAIPVIRVYAERSTKKNYAKKSFCFVYVFLPNAIFIERKEVCRGHGMRRKKTYEKRGLYVIVTDNSENSDCIDSTEYRDS